MTASIAPAAAEEGTLPKSHTSQYQPALDGIRALAVAAVLAYHAGFSWARGGFLGVDAFFVLSGFLITGLLLAEWRKRGRIELTGFWARRARRLLPALFLMLVGVALYAVFLASNQELGRIRGDALATIAYVANWRPIFAGQSYFDQYSVPSPLRHAWSLGIEEQYYIIWPLLVIVLLKLRRGFAALLIASVALMLGSALLMALLFQPGHDPSRVYYGTDTRAQSLLVGSVLSMLLLRMGPLQNRLLRYLLQAAALACAAAIGFFWHITPEGSTLLYRGGFLLLALGVAAVIFAAVQPRSGPLGKVLAMAPLRGLGVISYGVYLWHWPLYMVLTAERARCSGYELFGLRVLATLAIATASYHLIEKPLRKGAFRRWKVSWSFAPAAAAALIVALLFVTRGAVSPMAAYSVDDTMPEISRMASMIPTRVLLLGDSVALSMGPGLNDVSNDYNMVVWDHYHVGCGFLPVDAEYDFSGNLTPDAEAPCWEYQQGWMTDIAAFHPDIVVMVFGAMDSLDREVNGTLLATGTPEWEAFVTDGLQRQVQAFLSQGTKVALLTFPCSKPAAFALLPDPEGMEQDTYRRINALDDLFRRFAAAHPDEVTLIDLNHFACPEDHFTDVVIDGVKMRDDGLHFTPQGSTVVANWLAPQLVQIVRPGEGGTEQALDGASDGQSASGGIQP